MKGITYQLLALVFAFMTHLGAAAPAGRTQQMTSPDQVPKGLEKSDWSSIRAAYEAGRHAFQPVEGQAGVWQARNPGQQWLMKFDGRGFVAEPASGRWQWGLELKSYGFAGQERSISGQPEVKAVGQRLTYQWDANVQEWFVNDPRGLEHGFTIKEHPFSSPLHSITNSELSFLISTRGSLRPIITADAQGVLFQDAAGATVLNNTGLKVWDADGKILVSHFEAVAENSFILRVAELGARYPITIDPVAQQAYLKASNTDAGDQFGYSVAISGDRVAVGAPYEASNASGVNAPISGGSGTQDDNSVQGSGAVYIFKRTTGGWIQEAYLKKTGPEVPDEDMPPWQGALFGSSLDLDGDTLVVGTCSTDYRFQSLTNLRLNQRDYSDSGSVYVYVFESGVWIQQARILDKDAEAASEISGFGISTAVSNNTLVIGSMDGSAYVYTRDNGIWSRQATLFPSGAGVCFSVDIFNDTAIIGSPELHGSSEAAFIFKRTGSTWVQEAVLKPSTVGVLFGYSVSIDGETAVVGAPSETPPRTEANSVDPTNPIFRPYTFPANAGAAYVFRRSSGQWNTEAYLQAANPGGIEGFGISVAVSSDIIVVGAVREHTLIEGGGSIGGGFTGPFFRIHWPKFAGSAAVFTRSNQAWKQQAYLTPASTLDIPDVWGPQSTDQERDNFGFSVAVDQGTVVVGANMEDSNSTGGNTTTPNELDNSATDAGAAYVFTGFGANGTHPSISISGNQQSIINGDRVPSRKDHTDFTSSWKNTGVIERTFTIHNKGNSPLNLTGTPTIVLVGRNGLSPVGFSLTKAPLTSIPANTSTTFKIALNSGIGGNDTSIVIKSDDPNQKIYTFFIKGNGDVSREYPNPPATPLVTALGTSKSPGSVLTTLTPTFSWKLGRDNFGSYGLEIINRVTGEIAYSNEVIGIDEYSGSVGTTLTSFTLPEGVLRPGFQYSWTLRGLYNNQSIASRASAPLYFSIAENAPVPAKLTTLSPGAKTTPGPVITTLTPAFLWKPLTGTLNHALSILDLSTGTLAYSNDTLGATGAFNLPAGILEWGKAYGWTVRACNGAGWGVSSDLFYFQTKSDLVLLTPPSLTAPGGAAAPGAVVSSLTPAFTWKTVTGATGYGLYIADAATNLLVYDRDDLHAATSLTLPAGILQWGRAYRWNMRTKGSTGWSAFSSRLFSKHGRISSRLVSLKSPQMWWSAVIHFKRSGSSARATAQVLRCC